MTDPASITHIVFDIGGVIIEHARSWREAHERTDIPWDDYLGSPEFFEATRDSVDQHMAGLISPEEWCATAAALASGRVSAQDAMRILEAWLFDEYPGVGEVIDEIHAAGRVTATLSNANPVHWTLLERYPAFTRIQHPISSHHLLSVKPRPEIYEAFEARTGFPRGGVLFFDDTRDNVTAASAFGWRAEFIDHTGDPAAQLRAHLRRHGVL